MTYTHTNVESREYPHEVERHDAEYGLFYRALLKKRPIILRSLLIVATPYPHEVERQDIYTFDIRTYEINR